MDKIAVGTTSPYQLLIVITSTLASTVGSDLSQLVMSNYVLT
jgi:hypothetical protein